MIFNSNDFIDKFEDTKAIDNMFNFHDVTQNSDEWYKLRAGKVTSSNLACVMAHYGKYFGEPAQRYASQIAIEKMTGIPIASDFTNTHMQRGNEQEQEAKELYEEQTFSKVSNGGFFENGFIGASPDGLVGDDGVIEIKSTIPNKHYENIKRQNINPSYKWQCANHLYATGRVWLDFISFCKDFPIDKQLFIWRIYRDDCLEYFKKIYLRLEQFQGLVNEATININ